MEEKKITLTSKAELINAVSSIYFDERIYNRFYGEIRKGERYVKVDYLNMRDKVRIEVTYWRDGTSHGIQTASHCSSYKGLVSKVANFLNLK